MIPLPYMSPPGGDSKSEVTAMGNFFSNGYINKSNVTDGTDFRTIQISPSPVQSKTMHHLTKSFQM